MFQKTSDVKCVTCAVLVWTGDSEQMLNFHSQTLVRLRMYYTQSNKLARPAWINALSHQCTSAWMLKCKSSEASVMPCFSWTAKRNSPWWTPKRNSPWWTPNQWARFQARAIKVPMQTEDWVVRCSIFWNQAGLHFLIQLRRSHTFLGLEDFTEQSLSSLCLTRDFNAVAGRSLSGHTSHFNFEFAVPVGNAPENSSIASRRDIDGRTIVVSLTKLKLCPLGGGTIIKG